MSVGRQATRGRGLSRVRGGLRGRLASFKVTNGGDVTVGGVAAAPGFTLLDPEQTGSFGPSTSNAFKSFPFPLI